MQKRSMPQADMPANSGTRRTARWIGAGLVFLLLWMLVAVLRGTYPFSAQPATDKGSQHDKRPETTRDYVRDEASNSCHQDKAGTYHQTAHAHTSSLPSKDSIHGSFRPGSNTLETTNPNLSFLMESSPEGFFQTALVKSSPSVVNTRKARFDIVIGSGRKGQTYLYWDEDKLFQLPVTYWTELGEWMNSPGYIDGTANFERSIGPRCFECHASLFEPLVPPVPPFNRYNKTSVVLGMSCERCHGPGREHVSRYRSASPPRSGAGTAIINPARLSRDRQMDVCALCHGGVGKTLAPTFSVLSCSLSGHSLSSPQVHAEGH